jgi:tRNA nucleotidyltransferase (CCA-adding enzyme)
VKRTLESWADLHSGDVSPSAEERKKAERVAGKMLELTKVAVQKTGIDADVLVGGSFAHDTWLPDEGDIDIFVAFPPQVGKSGLERVGLRVARSALRGHQVVIRFAEHPYAEGFIDGMRVNIVPCLKTGPGEWVSAADRSPYHTEYMRRHLDDGMRLQVRLLKRLLKTQRLYGAEIKVRGFSGYVCEVLIVTYGNVRRLVREAADWRNTTTVSKELPITKHEGFSILDPVDTRRNLARAIAPARLSEFIFICGLLERGTACDPFVTPLLRYNKVKRKSLSTVYVMTFKHSERTEDKLWGELQRSSTRLVNHLQNDGFQVLNYTIEADEKHAALAILLAGRGEIDLDCRVGPEPFMRTETLKFLTDARNVGWWFSEDFRSRRLEGRRLGNLMDAVKFYMQRPVERIGFSKGLASMAARSWKLFDGDDAFRTDDVVISRAVGRLFGYSRRIDTCR